MSPLGLQTCVTFHLPHLNSVTLPPGLYRPETRETHPQVLLILPSKCMSNLSPALHWHCPLAWTLQYLLQQIVAVEGHPASSHCIFCSRSWFSSGRCASPPSRNVISRKLGLEHMTKARPMAPSIPLASDWFRDGHKTEVTPSRANETQLPNLIVLLVKWTQRFPGCAQMRGEVGLKLCQPYCSPTPTPQHGPGGKQSHLGEDETRVGEKETGSWQHCSNLIKPYLNPFLISGLSATLINKFRFYMNHFGLGFLTCAIKRMMQYFRISPHSLLLSHLPNVFHTVDCKVTVHCPKDKTPKSLTWPLKPRVFLSLIHYNPAMLKSSVVQICQLSLFIIFSSSEPFIYCNLCLETCLSSPLWALTHLSDLSSKKPALNEISLYYTLPQHLLLLFMRQPDLQLGVCICMYVNVCVCVDECTLHQPKPHLSCSSCYLLRLEEFLVHSRSSTNII